MRRSCIGLFIVAPAILISAQQEPSHPAEPWRWTLDERVAVRFDPVSLLPGKYRLRVHALDAEGLRLFDTLEVEFVVRGETRDYGLVALAHQWQPGSGGSGKAPHP